MIRAALTVAAKDLRLFVRDKVALLMSFALPIVLATVFGAAMGSVFGGGDANRIELLFEDLDGSPASKALLVELQAQKALQVEVRADVRSRVERGSAPAAILVPAGFGEDVAAGRKPRLVLYRDPGKEIEQQILAGNLVPVLMRATGPAVAKEMMKRGMEAMGFPAGMREMAESMFDAQPKAHDGAAATNSKNPFDFDGEGASALGLQVEDVAGGSNSSQKSAGGSHAIAGIAVMMLLFGLTACGGTILEEEESGTLQRVRLTPNAGASILVGKMLFTVAVGLSQLVLLFVYGGLVFGVPVLAEPLALFVHSVAVACAAAGFGLCLAVLCRTRKQLEGLSTLLILTMSALGGSWFPLAIVPEWFRTIGHFTLNAWAMDGYQGILWYGKGLSGIALDVLVLLAIAVATGWFAWAGWKRRFERTD
ncbi:MAG: ABC transporter permease [Planctomycetota bacterium]|nr:ABC transporter permease [Planctomycetota bacterium]